MNPPWEDIIVPFGTYLHYSSSVHSKKKKNSIPLELELEALQKLNMAHSRYGGRKEQSKKITALVVDDNMINQTIHHRLLDNLGIENEVVGNGKEAVDAHCSGKKFDLILMDMDMPIMNGIEATRTLREMGIDCMIAGVSSRSMEQEIQEFVEAGLDDYQEKPLTMSKLISIIHKINLNGS